MSTSANYKIGDLTPYGEIKAMGIKEGERFYMMEDKHGTVSLIPAELLTEGGDHA